MKTAIVVAILLGVLTLGTAVAMSSMKQIFPPVPRPQGNATLQNGDFSQGLAHWTTVSDQTSSGVRGEYPIFEVLTQAPGGGASAACFPSDRLGNPFLNIETPYGANGYVAQQVTVPVSGARLQFVVWGWEGNNATLGFSGLVEAYTTIMDANGIEHTLDTFSPPVMFTPSGTVSGTTAVCTGKVPVLKAYDLSAYADQTVQLELGSSSANCCGTNAFFDDVQVGTSQSRLSITPECTTLQYNPNDVPALGVSGVVRFNCNGGIATPSPDLYHGAFVVGDGSGGASETFVPTFTLPAGYYALGVVGAQGPCTDTNGNIRVPISSGTPITLGNIGHDYCAVVDSSHTGTLPTFQISWSVA